MAIEAVSNFILVEEYAEGRGAKEWNEALKRAKDGLNVDIVSVTSDGAKGIKVHVEKELGVQHTPDILHIQLEISKATAAPLRKQEEEFFKQMQKTEARLKKLEEKQGKKLRKQKLKEKYLLIKYGYDLKKERRSNVQKAIRGISEDFHPINLKDGRIQDPTEVKKSLEKHFKDVEDGVRAAGLKATSLKRVEKAKRQIKPIVDYLNFFFVQFDIFIQDLALEKDEMLFFKEKIFPLSYLEKVKNKSKNKLRKEIEPLIEKLKVEVKSAANSIERTEFLKKKADEIASLFQRSSSCVEGRNGVLSLLYHGHQGLTEKRLKALTVVHNFIIKREDGTTAAERFFQEKPIDIFEELLKRVKIPEKPRAKWKKDRKGLTPKNRDESLGMSFVLQQVSELSEDNERKATIYDYTSECRQIDQNSHVTGVENLTKTRDGTKLLAG